MNDFLSFNSKIISAGRAEIPAASFAGLYGKGIFTTIAICDGQPFLWEKHLRRLANNAAKIGLDLSGHTEDSTRNALNEIIEKNGLADGRARITFFDESASSIWPFKSDRKTSLLITIGEFRPVPDNLRLTASPYVINSSSPLAGVKSCNYLENLLAFDEAKQRGFDEAIRTNERGHVASGCMANIFWLKDNLLFTPSLKTGCLAGTTREFVLENLDCREVAVSIDELHAANAIHLTSAGLGVVAVKKFDSRNLTGGDFPITKLLS